MQIRNKLLITLIPAVCIVLVSIIYVTYRTTNSALEKEIRLRAMSMLDFYAATIDSKLKDMEEVPRGLKVMLESAPLLSDDQLKNAIEDYLDTKPDAYGSAVAFEPRSFDEAKELFGPYVYRGANGFVFIDLARPAYNYPEWNWYKTPIASGQPLWSEPYVDKGGGNVAMSTYSIPFFKNGKPWGVATVDVALSKLTRMIDQINFGGSGYAFLLSEKGTFLSMRREEWNLKLTILDVAKQFKSDELKSLGQEMLAGNTGYLSLMDPLTDEASWVAYTRIPSTDWSLAIVLPHGQLMAELTRLHRVAVAIALVGLFAVFLIVFFISTKISGSLAEIAAYAKRVASGDFKARLRAMNTNDEAGVLAKSFIDMQDRVADKLEQLVEEKEMFKVAFSQMTDGVIIASSTWKIVEFNHAAAKLLGLPSKSLLIEHLDAHFDSSIPLMSLANQKDEKHSFNLTSKLSGESELRCTLSPVVGEGAHIKAYVMTVRPA